MTSHLDVTVKKTEPRTVAFLSEKGSFQKIGQTIGKLFGLIQERGYAVAGAPIGVYFNDPKEVPEEELLWEIQFPVGDEMAAGESDESGLGVKRLEAYDVASNMHKGPYEGLGKVYEDMVVWMLENGYEIAGPPEEVYLNDPNVTPRDEILTEVRFPVKKN
jgi:effector-binding domain-containing protein